MLKFEVGQKLWSEGLYGCSSSYEVVSVTSSTVQFSVSHVSEDSGLVVNDGIESFDIMHDADFNNSQYVVIYEYLGFEGRLYPKH